MRVIALLLACLLLAGVAWMVLEGRDRPSRLVLQDVRPAGAALP